MSEGDQRHAETGSAGSSSTASAGHSSSSNRKTVVSPEATARTELGQRLRALRKRIVESGTPLLGWDELAEELRQRRGEFHDP